MNPPRPDRTLLDDVRAELLSGHGPARGGTREASTPERSHVASAISSARVLGATGVLRAAELVHAELVGAGPLQPLIDMPGTSDVLVNGPRSVWVDRGRGLEPTDLDLGSEAQVRALAVRLATASGRRLDDACPWVDARLPGGVRLHAVLPPVAVGGTLVCLRVPPRWALTPTDLVERGTLPASWVHVLQALIARRRSFLVTGGTGSGKTTVLGALLGLVDPAERIVIVEDATELAPSHPHVVHLQARLGNVEGAGSVQLSDLVRQALRMRGDRIVVGEVRGPEVRDLLAALNTGHEGGCGTLHANTATDVPARLEALAALAGLDRGALAAQAVSALDVVVHLRRDAGMRRVVEVAVVERGHDGHLAVLPALTAGSDPLMPGASGPGWDALARLLDLPPSWPPPTRRAAVASAVERRPVTGPPDPRRPAHSGP